MTRPRPTRLAREIGLVALAATGICSMLGAAINIIPFAIQRNVPGIGPHVLLAYAIGAVPAILAALAYAILASGMPRAGGSYIYASRGVSPYLGFIASFSQWFGLSVAIGVVAYMLVPFLRDIASTLELVAVAGALEHGGVRVAVALAFLWTFVGVNLRGVKSYARTLVPLMFLMFIGGAVVIWTGFTHTQAEFVAAVVQRDGASVPPTDAVPLDFSKLLAAAAILFASFIGFDSIAQAGGEAKNPNRTLPLAIGISMVTVGGFYMLFTAAVYHAVPWSYVAERSLVEDVTAPGLLGYLIPPAATVLIVAGAAIALINDLPAMLLAVSRIMFAWAEDGVFPRFVARVHPVRRTPDVALLLSGAMASLSILACQLAGDFFLGVDILAISMLVNFLVVSLAVLTLARRNPELAAKIRFVRSRPAQVAIGSAGVMVLAVFLGILVAKDLRAELDGWYLHSTLWWLVVVVLASVLYWRERGRLRARGIDVERVFSELPPE